MALRAGDPESIGGYVLEERLGRGGMGTVYLARSSSGRRIALKVVHQQFADDDEFRVRFRQEVAAARRVSGAFTAPVVDADPDAPLPWMATSYVPGRTLAERVAADGPLRGAELRLLAIGLGEALRDIHRAGVVHRDLKPANIVLSDEGPRVIDFGIARAADHQTLTMTGRVMGTPPYMSPEQLRDPREVGPESDVFSLATVLVFAATGQSPFDADSPYMTAYHVVYEPPDLDSLRGPMRDALADCLGKEPGERPGLDTLLARLRALPADDSCVSTAPRDEVSAQGAEGPEQEDTGTVPAAGRPRRRAVRGAVVAGVAAAVAGTLVLAGLAVSSSGSGQRRAEPGPSSTAAGSLPDGWRPWHRTLPVDERSADQSGLGSGNGLSGSRCTRTGDELYCGGPGALLTRLTATGHEVWRRAADDRADQIVGLAGKQVISVVDRTDGTSRMEGHRRTDGKRVWRTDVGRAFVNSVFTRGGGHAVLTQNWDAETFQAVDAVTGAIRWSHRISRELSCSGVVIAERPYAQCRPPDDDTDEHQSVWALDPRTGAPTRIATRMPGTVIAEHEGRLLYVQQRSKKTLDFTDLVLVDPDGKDAPRRVALPPGLRGDQVTPELLDGILYFVRDNGEVTSLTLDGRQRWRSSTQVEFLGLPVLSERHDALYLTTAAGRVVALDRGDGRVRWRGKPRTDPGGPPADTLLMGDALYLVYGYERVEVASVDARRRS
ncbi:protein kinase domain-containing protein [Streptomyces cucumeris]|uniref:serine/threonine-protein kinase n=1 Tax=Streptomyces cucumeris TaxID=2962890 RepID=UPI003D747702